MVLWYYRCLLRTTSYGYAGYKSRLRTTGVALATTGLSSGQADIECCSSYRGRLETTRVLLWQRTTKLAFCGL